VQASSPNSVQALINEGYNIFRVPFMMERMVPTSLAGAFGADYLKNYTATIDFIANAGAYAVLDPHNYGRYKGNVINNTSDFQSFWKNFAGQFKSNTKAIFDTNNEYNTMDQTLVLDLNQAAINGIRAAGATSQYIFVEGNQWSGAHSWTSVNTNMVSLTDPQNKIVYEMHQYFDETSSSSSTCVSGTIGAERLVSATDWLRQNKKVAWLGEFSGYPNSVCLQAVTTMLDYMQANSDVWLGGAFWAAGPWWGTSEYSFEPPDGPAYKYFGSTLKKYVT
jgi:endoglucanase